MSQYALPDPRRRRAFRSARRPAPLVGSARAKLSGEMSLATPLALPLVAKAATVNVREAAPEHLFAEDTREIRQRFADFVIGTDTALAETLKAEATAHEMDLADYIAARAHLALKGASA